MTPRQRFLTALAGRRPDRPPLAHAAVVTTVELQEATGCPMPEVHHDAAAMVKLLAANHYVLGFDAVTFIINFFNEPAALGVEMDWGSPTRLPEFKSHPWQEAPDAVVPGDLATREPIRTNLAALEIAKAEHGRRIAVLGKIMGPLSMVQVMHGVEETMIGLVETPERIARFLDVAVEILVESAALQTAAGIDALVIGEGGAGAKMLSPAMYERFLLPVHRRLIRRIDAPTVMHICGDILPRLGMLGRTGMSCFNFDWAIPPKVMVEAAAGKFTLMGNVNTTDLLRAAPSEIKQQTRACVEAGVDIISPGCAVSPRCPNASFLAMARALT